MEITKNKAFSKEYSAWIAKQERSVSVYEDFCKYFGSDNFNNSPDFLSRSKNVNYSDCLRHKYREKNFGSKSLLRKIDCHPKSKQISDISELTLPYALKMDDRFYMSQGVEARHPFLDYRLVELGLSIPPTMKIRNGISKFVLRSAIRNYIPSSRRKDLLKIGLNLPIDKWMRGPLKNWLVENLVNNENPIFEFADYQEVKKIVNSHLESKANHYLKLWDLINVNIWLKRFFN